MHIEMTDIHLTACELTEEFLAQFAVRLSLPSKRALRLQALPLIQQYLHNDVACGLTTSTFLFRTALNEDKSFSEHISKADFKKHIKNFLNTPEFVRFANSIEGPNGADTQKEFANYLEQYVWDLRNKEPQKHNMFNNSATNEQDFKNHNILERASHIVFDHIFLAAMPPISVLRGILDHAAACQQQLNPSISVKPPTTEQWVNAQRGETSPPATRSIHR